MAFILSLETATPVCSVALHDKGALLAHFSLFLEKSHSAYLTEMVHDALRYANRQLAELDAVALSEGPGSYTGLRIGASAAKGLCYALDIPVVTINTLAAHAYTVQAMGIAQPPQTGLLCPMLDARRMEVYSALYTHELKPVAPTSPVVVNEEAYHEYLNQGLVYFFGNGAAKCKPVLSLHPNARFVDGIVPSAASVGQLAIEKVQAGTFANLAYFEPFYLKEFKAIKPKQQL